MHVIGDRPGIAVHLEDESRDGYGLLSADAAKADRAEAVVRTDSLISVQVLSELTSVARRKLALSWEAMNDIIELIRSLCAVESVTIQTHNLGRALAQRYQLPAYVR